MLKISKKPGPQGESVLKIEGSLGGAWVSEVRSACGELLAEGAQVRVDLSGVTFVDRAGSELLESLRADRRVVIESASAFVTALLKGGAA